MSEGSRQRARFVLVEDNPVDIELITGFFSGPGSDCNCDLVVLKDGDAALEFIEAELRPLLAGGRTCGSFLILDLNLPGTDGRDVLRHVKSDEVLCALPVIVCTGSALQSDVTDSYLLGANSYMVKPADTQEFARLLEKTCRFWIQMARLP